jgi:uncharacterized protein involved in outer membrane biogenesis
MTRKKKILIASGIIAMLLLAAVVILPLAFKDKIKAAVKQGVNENLNAKVDFTEVGVSMFRHFPYLTVTVDSVTIVGVAPFEGDTLLKVGRITASADVWSLIAGEKIRIRSIYLNTPMVNLIVLEDGRANWDIAKADSVQKPQEPSQGINIELKRYGIRNGNISYSDRSMGLDLQLINTIHKGRGDFADEQFSFSTSTQVEAFNLSYGGVKYISRAKADLSADLDMDMKNMKFTFKDNELRLNTLIMGFSGHIAMPSDPIEMDLKFDIQENDFSQFVSLIPGAYKEGFDKAKSSGTLALSGFIKGTYSATTMPGFGIKLKVEKGQFSYPELPVALSNVEINLDLNNPDGVPDHTIIDLSKMHLEIGKDPFDMRLLVKTPVSDPQIDGSIKGKINLSNVAKMFPLENETKLSGVLEADVAASGRMSAIENKRYQYFRAEGILTLNEFKYISSDFKQGLDISSAELIFNPKNITLNRFNLQSGKTKLSASGWIDNLMGYMFKEDQLLTGTLDINADMFDMNAFVSDTPDSTATNSQPTGVIEVPKNIDFQLSLRSKIIEIYEHKLSDATGNLVVRDRTMGLNGCSFQMLEGRVSINGFYDTKDLKKPNFFMNLELTGLDVRKTYDAFVSVKKLAPIAEKCNGKYSSVFSVKGEMDQHMEPIYGTLTGGGKLMTANVTIDNFKPLVKLAETLKMDQFKKFPVDNLNLSFKFENGRVNVDPFDLIVSGVKSNVSGSSGFDQTIDYLVVSQVPMQVAGFDASQAINILLEKANKLAGTSYSMGKEMTVRSRITGTVNDPKIDVGFGAASKADVASPKEQIKDIIETKKNELEDKAKAEADRLKKEAEAKAEQLKKEAEAKAKAEAERLKKELEEKAKKEAEDRLRDLFGKPK